MENFVIRNATIHDAKSILSIYAPYIQETAITYEYTVPSLWEFKKRMKGIMKKYPYIVAEKDGEILGYAYAGEFHARKAYEHSTELSIYVRRDLRKAGLGKALYGKLEQLLKERDITALYACIAATSRKDDPYLNNDSELFHEKLGYSLCGRFTNCAYKFDLWYDMVYYEKHL